MSAIAPGPLLDIEDVGEPVAVAQTNFEEINEALYEFNPSKQNGVETTEIGPPTTGDHTLDERWRDAWNGEHRCTVAGTPGTWRQEQAAIRAGEPSSGTIPTGYLIQDSSDSYRFKIHMGGYVWRAISPNYYSTLTALTGGTTAALDGIATTSLAVGAVAQFVYNGKLHTYRLRAGTDSEVVPWCIRPDDYNASTNAKVWELVDITAYAPDRAFNELTGLTGGTALDLNAVPTVTMSVGRVIWFLNDGVLVAYKLVSDVSATSSPTKIRPADFQSVTNPKVWWQILRVSAPGDVLISDNNLSELSTSAAKRAASRTSIDVLWSDDVQRLAAGRSARGGILATQGTVATGATSSGFAAGTRDFSISFVLHMMDWTPTAAATIYASHSTGNNRFTITLGTNGSFSLNVTDSGGSATAYTMAPDVALVDGNIYRITITVDRDGNATLYVNAASDRDLSGSGVTVIVSGSSAVDIGSGNTNGFTVGTSMYGTIFELLLYNCLLSSSDVSRLSAHGSVLSGDQWALGTVGYTSDFSAGVDSWTSDLLGTVRQITGNTDSIGGEDNWLEVETLVTSSAYIYRTASSTQLQPAGHYRVTARVFVPSGSPLTHIVATHSGSQSDKVVQELTPNSIVTISGVFTANAFSYLVFAPSDASGVLNTSVAAGNSFYIKDITFERLGCRQALDFENTAHSYSTMVRDRSTNANNGTLTVTAESTRIARQLNAGALAVGASTILTKLLSAAATLDFGSINAAASADLTITVTGAAVGDSVHLGLPAAPTAGIIFQAFVSSTNTVTVRATNITGSPVDPASATYRATVMQFA